MKKHLVLLLMLISSLRISAQSGTPAAMVSYLDRLPALTLRENGPQRYVFSYDFLSFDLAGNMTGKKRVSGDYTRGLPEGKARWDNVRIAQAAHLEDAFPAGEPQKYMDGFSYNPSDTNTFKDSLFAGFPTNTMETKTLVWDVAMFQAFAWNYFDKLRLNEPYEMQPSDVPIAGGNFHNRRPVLTWIGVSKMNGKMCAVIQYQVFFNIFTLPIQGQGLQGRSDYWGTIWVSLTDKQIENGTLNEEVLMGLDIPGQPEKRTISIFREATLQRKR